MSGIQVKGPNTGGGATGAPGSVWRTGTGVPSNALGVDTDQYLNNTTGDVYTRSGGTYSITGNIRGPTGPNPLLVTGLTGGTADRLVYVGADGVTCTDLHVSMLDELNYNRLYFKDKLGQYWKPGATILDAANNLVPTSVRAMQPQTSSSTVNYRDIDPKLAQPSDLVATVNQDYVEFGKIITTGSWDFIEPRVDGLATTPTSRYDSFLIANYPRSTLVPTGRFQINQWNAFDAATPSNVYTGAVNTSTPHGAGITFNATNTYNTRIATDQVSGQAPDGQIQGLIQRGGVVGSLGLGMRISGTSTTKNGVLLSLDTGASAGNYFKLIVYLNNVATTLASHPTFVAANATFYRCRLECQGTLVRAKVWAAGGTEPTDWMLTAYQNICTTTGYFGLLSNAGDLYLTSYSTVINKGADAALTGVT